MDALKLRKDVSKPGLLRVAREVFDAVVEEVGGRKLSTVGCRGPGGVSGAARLAVAAWSIDDTQAFGGGNEMNLRRLYGLDQVLCDTTLRRPPGSDLAGAVSAGVPAGSVTRPARQGPASDVGVARS